MRVSVDQEPVGQDYAIDFGVAGHSGRGWYAGEQGNHLCNPIGPLLQGWTKGLWPAQDALQTTPHNREHVWPDHGLAPDRHAVRLLYPHILLSHWDRRNRHLLSQRMSPKPGSPSDSGSLIQSRYTWLGSASPRFCNRSLVSNCEQTAVGCSIMLIPGEVVVDTHGARRSVCGESGQSRERLSVIARGYVTSVSGMSYVRHQAQKEDLWSANAVGGYWYARPSMI